MPDEPGFRFEDSEDALPLLFKHGEERRTVDADRQPGRETDVLTDDRYSDTD